MYKKTVRSIQAVHKAMEALDSLDKQYTITKAIIDHQMPKTGDKDGIRYYPSIEWTITEVAEEEAGEVTEAPAGEQLATLHSKEFIINEEWRQEAKRDSGVGNLTFNVNVVSNIEDFSEKFTKEFEKVIEQIESMLRRPLSDYISVEVSAGDGS